MKSFNEKLASKIAEVKSVQPQRYQWMDEKNFEDGYLKAEVGDSPIVHFLVESDPQLDENTRHTFTKEGKPATKRFVVKDTSITFKEVRVEDSGMYIISCSNAQGLVAEDEIELEVIGQSLQ